MLIIKYIVVESIQLFLFLNVAGLYLKAIRLDIQFSPTEIICPLKVNYL